MWLLYITLNAFFLALTNYIDEYLTANNKLHTDTNIHKRIGGVLLMSTLMSFVGAGILFIAYNGVSLPSNALIFALSSSIPMVAVWASYFYLLTVYPVHFVIPLFQMSSIWTLLLEMTLGVEFHAIGLVGVAMLMVGAYFLDSGEFKWRIPTKLLLIMIPVSLFSSLSLFLVRIANLSGSIIAVSFWHLIGIGCIGIVFIIAVKNYRDGFLYRIRNQGRNFLGFSLLNETFAQLGYFFLNLATAAAPFITYVSALSGLQSIFILGLFILFPLNKSAKVNLLQIASIILMAVGVYVIGIAG